MSEVENGANTRGSNDSQDHPNDTAQETTNYFPCKLAQLQVRVDDDSKLILYGVFTAISHCWQVAERLFYSESPDKKTWAILPVFFFRVIPLLWICSRPTESVTPTTYSPRIAKRLIVAISILFHACDMFGRYPSIWDSDSWGVQFDVTLGLWIICSTFYRSLKTMKLPWQELAQADDDGHDSILLVYQTMTTQFAYFYFASGFWKLNSHFWDPNASCATMFVSQHISRYMGGFLSFVALIVGNSSNWVESTIIEIAYRAKFVAPALTLLVELSMGGSILAGRILAWTMATSSASPRSSSFSLHRCLECSGAVFALAFHFAVCMTPFPHDIAGFALTCAARLVVIPSEAGVQQALHELRRLFSLPLFLSSSPSSSSPWLTGVSSSMAVILYAVLCGSCLANPNQWAFALFAPISLVVTLALGKDLTALLAARKMSHEDMVDVAATFTTSTKTTSSPTSTREKNASKNWTLIWCCMCAALSFSYSFLGLLTGFQEESTPNMFANLKVHGGSNHWLLPTGLLLHHFAQYGDDSHPLGGGVVRLETTTSHWLQYIYPADFTPILEPHTSWIAPVGTTDLMQSIGYPSPSYFNPGVSRILGVTPWPATRFNRYTVPAVEWKRLLHEAKQRDADFEVTYSVLPGTKGDEQWRAFATAKRVQVIVRGGHVIECHVEAIEARDKRGSRRSRSRRRRCESTDLPLVSYDTVPSILKRLTMHHAYPIVTDNPEELPPSIVCFGP